MCIMRRLALSLVGIAAAAVSVSGMQQVLSAPEVIRIYLMQDCATGEAQPADLFQRVIALGETAVPVLIDAVRIGPPPDVRRAVEQDATSDFKRQREFLDRGGLQQLGNEAVAQKARELDEPSYVAMRVRSVVRGHQERALNALVEIRSSASADVLEKTAAEPGIDEDLRPAIRAAATQIRRRPR